MLGTARCAARLCRAARTSSIEEPLWIQAGGEDALRALLVDFYERVLSDAMIGFHFRDADPARLVEKELELALQLLGAPVRYTGEPLRAAHARHPIFGGQFMRRLQILKDCMADHDLPEAVRSAWVAHTLELRPLITDNATTECRPREDEGQLGS